MLRAGYGFFSSKKRPININLAITWWKNTLIRWRSWFSSGGFYDLVTAARDMGRWSTMWENMNDWKGKWKLFGNSLGERWIGGRRMREKTRRHPRIGGGTGRSYIMNQHLVMQTSHRCNLWQSIPVFLCPKNGSEDRMQCRLINVAVQGGSKHRANQ